MPATRCEKCGGPLPAHRGRHRPRKFCLTCRPPRDRGKPTPSGVVSEIRPGATAAQVDLVEATEKRLRDADKMADPMGLAVLEMARSIAAGGHSGASLASLVREFRACLDLTLTPTAASVAEQDVDWGVG